MLFVKAYATHTGGQKMTRKGTKEAQAPAASGQKMTRKTAKNK